VKGIPTARAPRAGKLPLAAAAVLLSLCLGLPPSPAGAADASERTFHTRPGITVRTLAAVPADARAVLLLFEGAQGLLAPGYQGFAHRVFARFAAHGIGAVLIDAPADGSGFRGGLDLDIIVAALKRDTGLPVWVLGVSNGTRSAARYAMQRSDRIAGVVLVSSSTNPPFGTPLGELPGIADVAVPLLAIAHRDDACRGSPPAGATAIAAAAANAPHAAAMLFTGGLNDGPLPCGVETHHQLYGLEDDVAAAIAWFITAHTPEAVRLTTRDPR